MTKLRSLSTGLARIATGQREISLSFATLTWMDCVLSLIFAVAALLRLPSILDARKRFLCLIEETFGSKPAFLFTSARSSLYFLLKHLPIERDSEVLITGYTCEVVPNAVIQAGLKPVYVDIETESYGMSPEALRARITPSSRVLILQHTYGIPAQIEALLEIAQEHGLYVIEDCAVSLGTTYRGRQTGTFGDAAIFSFELTKPITSGRGGLLLLNSSRFDLPTTLAKSYLDVPEQPATYAAQLLFQLGLSGLLTRPRLYALGKYLASILYQLGVFRASTSGPELHAQRPENYLLKLSPWQALLLSRQWRRLGQIARKRKDHVSFYLGHLGDRSELTLYQPKNSDSDHLIRYPLRVPPGSRDEIIETARQQGVELGVWFSAPLSSPEVDASLFGYHRGDCPVAEQICQEIVNLPTHMRLKPADLERVVSLFYRD